MVAILRNIVFAVIVFSGAASAGTRGEGLKEAEHSFVTAIVRGHLYQLVSDKESLFDTGRVQELYGDLIIDRESPLSGSAIVIAVNNISYSTLSSGSSDSQATVCGELASILCSVYARSKERITKSDYDESIPSVKFIAPPTGYTYPVSPELIEDPEVRAEYEVRYNAALQNQRNLMLQSFYEIELNQVLDKALSVREKVRQHFGDEGVKLLMDRVAVTEGDAAYELFLHLDSESGEDTGD